MSEAQHWEEHYTSTDRPPWDTNRVEAELQRRVAEFAIKPCRAIEFGCGTGTNAVWLAVQGFDVTAVDISPTALTRARERAARENVAINFVAADVTALPELGPPFEFFFDRGCYHAVRRGNAGGLLRQMDRVTAPGAWGIVLTGNAREERQPGPPVVTEAELRAELGRVFDIVSLEEFRFDEFDETVPRYLGWSCVLRKG